jgi:uncharacterized membrane protein
MGVESGLVISVVKNTLEVSQVVICNFSVFHMKYFWLKFRMMVRKKKKNLNRHIEARYRSDIGIHMMSWGDYICNLLWWIRLC